MDTRRDRAVSILAALLLLAFTLAALLLGPRAQAGQLDSEGTDQAPASTRAAAVG